MPEPELPTGDPSPGEQALAQLAVGAEIPPALRQAVGAALDWVDRLGRDPAAGLDAKPEPPNRTR